ncbi:hypothetical protein XENOCAPTIV_000034, partial [Xenoophorus captivus]
CRAVMIFFHYCVLSNYFWLFIEGLYLFTLLVETFFPEKRYFYWYIVIGWGETFKHGLVCWDINDNAAIWWVIKGPVLASIMGFVVAVLYCFLNGEIILCCSFYMSVFILDFGCPIIISLLITNNEINNDLVKYIPQGAIGNQEEMAQLDGEQVLCCGPEAPASFAGEQWGERGDTAVHPQQEQLADPNVQPAGRDPSHLSGHCGDASTGPAAADPNPPTLVPMTNLTDPFFNTDPDESTMETQLNSSDPKQPLV